MYSPEDHFSLEVLIAVILLVFYVIAAPIFEKVHFHYMHESGMVMILGLAITVLFRFLIPSLDFSKSLIFNDKIFFTFVLPLIIFGAGYNLKKRQFFKYFTYIFLLGVVGTLIAFLWVAPITFLFNKLQIFYLSSSDYDYDTLVKFGGIPTDKITGKRINYTIINETNETFVDVNETKYTNKTLENVTLNNNNSYSNYLRKDDVAVNGYNIENVLLNFEKGNKSIIEETNKSFDGDYNDHNETKDKEGNDTVPNTKHMTLSEYPILLDFSAMDALSFAAVISATDAVAALTFIHEDTEPKLFSILFGEGVVNDAVCIVIYKILSDFQHSGASFDFNSIMEMIKTFCSLFFWSFFVGLFMGVVGSLILKGLKKYNIGRAAECSLICLFAYLIISLQQLQRFKLITLW